jgi:hypothetical protein
MRFTLGDIGDPPLRSDTEYDALLALYDEPTATMKMAESLAAQYAQNPSSVSVGGVSVSFSSLVSTWLKTADNLRAAGAGKTDAGSDVVSWTADRFGDARSEYRRPLDWQPGDDSAW